MPYLLDEVRWGADFFIKSHVSANVFYAQVGDGDLDHSEWCRPEDLKKPRPAWKIEPGKPGSDLAGEVAAFWQLQPFCSSLMMPDMLAS